jgi:TolB-like protein/Flp pilus assembly protein TadD
MAARRGVVYQFGPFQLDIDDRLLTRDGATVPLTRKAFETLALLVENRGHALQKEEMLKRIWHDSFVEEATLAQNVFTLRRVLGESSIDVHYIETVPRLGYRFVAKVTEVWESKEADGEFGSGAVIRSIAVLPFKTLCAETDDEYFGLGIADALITRLSNIKEVVVRPTSAVLKYHKRDCDLYTAGRELRAQLALDGIVQRLEDRIRVTVQLVNVETGVPVWADKFDERFSDIFEVQDTISERVVWALTLKLTSAQQARLTKQHTKNSEAYRCYLRGRYLWNRWTENGFKKSIESFERAIEIEPDYALPYAGLADTYLSLGFYGYLTPMEAMPRVRSMATKALQLDDQLTEACVPLAGALFFYDWTWEAAEKEFKRSIDLSPGYAIAHQSYGLFLIAMGQFDEAESSFRQALKADPVSPLIRMTAGLPYYYSGQYDLAMSHYRETLEEDPYFGLAHVALADVYVQIGMYDDAIGHYEKAMSTWGRNMVLPYLGYAYALSDRRTETDNVLSQLSSGGEERIAPFSMAIVYTGLGDEEKALHWLDRAVKERSHRMVFLNVNPIFRRLRKNQRFIDLLKQIGLQV